MQLFDDQLAVKSGQNPYTARYDHDDVLQPHAEPAARAIALLWIHPSFPFSPEWFPLY